MIKRIAIAGGGPCGLFVLKRLIENTNSQLHIEIFEKHNKLGAGMPYSTYGAGVEHVTNVSGNEIPELTTSLKNWIQALPPQKLKQYNVNPNNFSDYKVVPRLLFGDYLQAQFQQLVDKAKQSGITVIVHLNTEVQDIIDAAASNTVSIKTGNNKHIKFDQVVVCSGHNWPHKHEGKIPGYYDSPYPPRKLELKLNHAVALKGSSLTAIDAIRTLARCNGSFFKDDNNKLVYKLAPGSEKFSITMHSLHAFLPAVRFHLEDSHLSNEAILTQEDINLNRQQNDGFLSLDFVFEKSFKEPIQEKRPQFYEEIKHMNIEAFVEAMMNLRERIPPFLLLKAEYDEAEKSIEKRKSVYWKEMLAVLSFTMNYPAKYFSAEDMLRLKKVLMPLITVVIAFVPQPSVEEMLALHEAGVLNIVLVDKESKTVPQQEGGIIYEYIDENNKPQAIYYKTFVDATGQPHLSLKDLPFKSLINNKTVSQAQLKFRSNDEGYKSMLEKKEEITKDENGNYFLNVPGIKINDSFQVVDDYGIASERIYMLAVPYIGGYNPDYSGLDFCEEASCRAVESILNVSIHA